MFDPGEVTEAETGRMDDPEGEADNQQRGTCIEHYAGDDKREQIQTKGKRDRDEAADHERAPIEQQGIRVRIRL